MGKLLFIDSDDIETLSEALQDALERRGVRFNSNGSGEFDYPSTDDEEEDIDPYLGRMPFTPGKRGLDKLTIDNDDESFTIGGCGVCRSGSYCGGSAYTPHYGGCGSHIGACGSWEEPHVHHSGGGCGDSYYYPRC
jgi:hypothetical protein